MIWLYNVLVTIGSLVWVPWMLVRARRRKEGVLWKERTGDYPFQLKKGVPRLWLHAVSVGEVMAALPVLRELRALRPDMEVVLSTTTSSGHRTAREKAEGLYDHLVYYPIDVYRFVLAALVRVRPTVVAVMETELWLNFLDAAHNLGVKTLLVNGRLSDRSFPRARAFKFFYRDLLRRLDRCLVQSETDAERFRALGATSVEVFGNTKYDEAAAPRAEDADHWRRELDIEPGRPVVVVGSTRSEAEETLVLAALREERLRGVQTVWAPRHLERAGVLEKALTEAGLAASRRTQPSQPWQVLVLDSYGELGSVYSVADVVVIGGGFDDLGGQNLIQPLALGKPVLHGPHMQNFRDVAEAAGRAGCALTVSGPAELADALHRLLQDHGTRAKMGEAAISLVTANLGAGRRYAESISEAAGPAGGNA